MDGWDAAATAELSLNFPTGPGSPPPTQTRTALRANAPGIWGNSLRVAALESTNGDPRLFRLVAVYRGTDQGAALSIVEDWDRLSADPANESFVVDTLRRSQYIRWSDDPGVQIERPQPVVSGRPAASAIITTHATALFGGAGGGGTLDPADYQTLMERALARVDDAALLVAACDAFLDRTTGEDTYMQFVDVFAGFADTRPKQDLFFIGDLPAIDGSPTEATSTAVELSQAAARNTFTAHYWPHVVASDPVGVGRGPTIVLPPAGFLSPGSTPARTDAAAYGRRRRAWRRASAALSRSTTRSTTPTATN
jgi:hypothetical protein